MATSIPPKKNTALVFYVALTSQSDPNTFQTNPTLAAGDVKVAIDNGSFNNLSSLPVVTPSGTKTVQVSLTSGEMNGDNIQVLFSDAAGAEWQDLMIEIQTADRWINDLAYPTTTGRSILTAADGSVAPDWANVKSPTTTVNLSGTTVKTATDVETDTADIQTRLPAALSSGRMDSSVGAMASDVITDTALANSAITEIQAGLADSGDITDILNAIAALNNLSSAQVAALLTATVADSVPADGTRPSIASGILMLTRFLMESSVSGTTVTVKKEDGVTSSMTFTINDASAPTSITRS